MAARKKARIRTVGIVVRPETKGIARQARKLATWLEKHRVKVLAHRDWVGRGHHRETVDRRTMMRQADLVVVLGGDGSLLGVARLSGKKPVPVLGINHGEFGFLTVSDRGNLYATMEKVLAGAYYVEQRSLLDVSVRRGGRVAERSQALNDAVVTRSTFSRLLALETSVDGEYLTTYMGDGLVIATPTGSTAYSLSAGGPVVDPAMNAIVLTPISAHSLTSRPFVLPDRSVVAVAIGTDTDDAVVTLDGQERFRLEAGDVVEATRSRHRAAVIGIDASEGFFGALRRKIHWGARGDHGRDAKKS
jgi:NAD+ kinase